jgi:hypothetical protein
MKQLWLVMLLFASPAWARQSGCAPVPVEVWIGLPQARAGVARVGLGEIEGLGTNCQQLPSSAPVTDILHGAPASKGLLRGDGPRDVLHMVRDSLVTIQPRPP